MTTDLNLSPIMPGYGGVAGGPGHVGSEATVDVSGGAHTLAMRKVKREIARNIDDREGEENMFRRQEQRVNTPGESATVPNRIIPAWADETRRERDVGKGANIAGAPSEKGRECVDEEKRRGWAKEIADMLADVSEFRKKVSPGFFWKCGEHNEFHFQLRKANGWAQNSANHPMTRPAFLKWADENMPELRRKLNKFQVDKEGMLDAKKQQQRQQWLSAGGTVCNLAGWVISIALTTVILS